MRQLYLYGFKRYIEDGDSPGEAKYYNGNFQRDSPELLWKVSRKKRNSKDTKENTTEQRLQELEETVRELTAKVASLETLLKEKLETDFSQQYEKLSTENLEKVKSETRFMEHFEKNEEHLSDDIFDLETP